jgi:hypothetical protein
VYGLCILMGIEIESEVDTYLGRIDIVLTTKTDIFIFELKYNGSAQEAIDQINQREYYSRYIRSEKAVTLVGVSFDSEKRTLSDGWIIKKHKE